MSLVGTYWVIKPESRSKATVYSYLCVRGEDKDGFYGWLVLDHDPRWRYNGDLVLDFRLAEMELKFYKKE